MIQDQCVFRSYVQYFKRVVAPTLVEPTPIQSAAARPPAWLRFLAAFASLWRSIPLSLQTAPHFLEYSLCRVRL